MKAEMSPVKCVVDEILAYFFSRLYKIAGDLVPPKSAAACDEERLTGFWQ